jgi:hypothetical protein
MNQLWISFFLFSVLLLVPQELLANNEETIVKTCGYHAEGNENPSYQVMNCLLTEAALRAEVPVPPEIVKGIATQENGEWKHFDEAGEVVVSDDGGIGLMQITNIQGYDRERLRNDLVYNIETAVNMLVSHFKRGDLPRINDHHPQNIESWYFAVMAYNGIKPVNSPVIQKTGERNQESYQESVFRYIEDRNSVTLKHREILFKADDFNYDPNQTANINFLKMNYELNDSLTQTKHAFQTGDVVFAADDVKLRPFPSTTSLVETINVGETLKVTGDFVYDERSESLNHFVWYPVSVNEKTGYIASSYIQETEPTFSVSSSIKQEDEVPASFFTNFYPSKTVEKTAAIGNRMFGVDLLLSPLLFLDDVNSGDNENK